MTNSTQSADTSRGRQRGNPRNAGGVQRTGASPPAFCRALLCLLALASLPPLAPAHAAGTGIEHIVIVWLNDPGNRADRERILAESRVLTAIPGVTGLRSGRMIPSQRPVVDSSFDVALIVSLSAREALQAYLTHPVHVQLVEETLKPLVKKILVYDIGP